MAVNKRKKTICRIVEQTDSIKRYWKDFRKYCLEKLDKYDEKEMKVKN